MIYCFYRYAHPELLDTWLYVGQGPERHGVHKRGKSAFGFRYQQLFSDVELAAPVEWCKNLVSQHEADEEEAISMFQFQTWATFPWGMNLQLPGRVNFDKVKILGEIRRSDPQPRTTGRH